jgi:hypothetical protein
LPPGLLKARDEVDAESETLRRLTALRDTVASQARGMLEQQDREALWGLIASAFANVFLDPSGQIAWMNPGAKMEHSVPLVVMGGEVVPGCNGDGASNERPTPGASRRPPGGRPSAPPARSKPRRFRGRGFRGRELKGAVRHHEASDRDLAAVGSWTAVQ